ncbi:site-specific integrase, partial [Nocardia salmonicida]
MAPGEWGKVTVTQTGPGQFTAYAYVRDEDGNRRKVRRSGSSPEAARRNLLRHLKERAAPLADAVITDRTTLAELFPIWLATKTKLKPQSRDVYEYSWARNGRKQLGALRIRELPTSRAETHLGKIAARSESNAKTFRVVLLGMFALAVRYDVLPVNPIRETSRTGGKQSGARALTPDEFARVREAVRTYRDGKKGFGLLASGACGGRLATGLTG